MPRVKGGFGTSQIDRIVPSDQLGDQYTNALSNKKQWMIEFMHLPTQKRLWFHGFITQLGDSFNSDWHDEDVFGRMDPISIFKSTKRNINLAFVVPAVSEAEAKDNVYTINCLCQFLYPVYENLSPNLFFQKNLKIARNNPIPFATNAAAARMMTQADVLTNRKSISKANYMVSPPLLRIRFTNLIHNANSGEKSNVVSGGLVVKVNGNLNIQPDLNLGMFGQDPGMLYPKGWAISMNLTVFHTHTMGWQNHLKDGDISFSDNRRISKNFPYGVIGS